MRTLVITLLTATLVCTSAALAYAGPRIVTPRLRPPTDGRLRCTVVNASATRNLDVRITIYKFDGDVAIGPGFGFMFPNASASLSTTINEARHCVVEVVKGGKRNARVALVAEDSSSNPLAAVSGK